MNMKMIPCQVRDEHILGAGVVAGASGSGNDAALQMEFGPMWDALVKYVTFRDALGENPVVVLLTTDMIRLYQKPILPPRWEEGCVFPPPPGCCPPPGPACPPHREPEDGEEERPAGELYKPPTQETQVYIVPIPAKAKALEGRMKVTVQGYSLSEDGGQAETATMTASAYFKVLPSGWAMPEDESVSATHAQQLQGEIEKIKGDIVEAAKAADAKEAALEQAGKAKESADAAAGSAATAEAAKTAAAESATAAEAAQEAAGESADAAETAKEAALEQAGKAKESADVAAGSANAAEAAKTAAETAKETATEQAGKARESAQAAAGSAGQAENAVTAAQEKVTAAEAAKTAAETAKEAALEQAGKAQRYAAVAADRGTRWITGTAINKENYIVAAAVNAGLPENAGAGDLYLNTADGDLFRLSDPPPASGATRDPDGAVEAVCEMLMANHEQYGNSPDPNAMATTLTANMDDLGWIKSMGPNVLYDKTDANEMLALATTLYEMVSLIWAEGHTECCGPEKDGFPAKMTWEQLQYFLLTGELTDATTAAEADGWAWKPTSIELCMQKVFDVVMANHPKYGAAKWNAANVTPVLKETIDTIGWAKTAAGAKYNKDTASDMSALANKLNAMVTKAWAAADKENYLDTTQPNSPLNMTWDQVQYFIINTKLATAQDAAAQNYEWKPSDILPKATMTWKGNMKGPKGQQGPQGTQGTQGDRGKAGPEWFCGVVVNKSNAADTVVAGAKIGDFYLNTETGDLFRVKASKKEAAICALLNQDLYESYDVTDLTAALAANMDDLGWVDSSRTPYDKTSSAQMENLAWALFDMAAGFRDNGENQYLDTGAAGAPVKMTWEQLQFYLIKGYATDADTAAGEGYDWKPHKGADWLMCLQSTGGLLPQLVITANVTNAHIVASCGEVNVEGTCVAGKLTLDLPSYGNWMVNGYATGMVGTYAVNVDAVKQYPMTLTLDEDVEVEIPSLDAEGDGT